ncbi:MAG: trypsin-like peptidase domain-containing protein [Proteobacteria bacterium]|nr:trypsin-like peptidase domain-containing protein [Pseudomonadota bacterium]
MNASAVVRIYCTSQNPDYDAPWQSQTPRSSTGSGMAVGPGRILTGAHVVANATFLQVQKVDDPKKYTARLAGVCHDSDLALLEVDDPAYNNGVEPVVFGALPALRDRVSVVGFPVGGQEVSVTEGIVSRIEMQDYTHSRRRLLAITVDAAINSGNSGGPVFSNGNVIGVAFQSLRDAEGIGEVVPTVLIERFLSAVEAGRSTAIPALSIRTQKLENPTLRKALGMSEKHSGVRLRAVEHGGSAEGHLKVGDVLLAIDGHTVANNGTIRYADRFRTGFSAAICERFAGDEVVLRVLRDGEELDVSIVLADWTPLAPRYVYDVRPRYLVYAGLVFQPLSQDFLATWVKWWKNAPPEFIHTYYNVVRTHDREEAVVLSRVLADELTVGYTDRANELLESVNGTPVRGLAHLRELVDAATGPIEFRTSWNASMVFETVDVEARRAGILERYRITTDRSDQP